MRARHKLNQAYVNGSLITAAVIGGLAQSWVVFAVALVALLGLNVAARNIR
jgi:hypothetical protein